MRPVYENEDYIRLVREYSSDPSWDIFRDSSLLISGATGMIGSFILDVIFLKNKEESLGCNVYAIGRSRSKAERRFPYIDDTLMHFIECDISEGLTGDFCPEYVIHAASSTHPLQYSGDPIGTIKANVFGTDNLLSYAATHNTRRFAFLSSVEIYGENRGDTGKFSEDYLGYIDCNTMRAGYPESKRCGEALCQAYIAQKGMDIVIPRLSRVYGPTILESDTKAISQFIRKGALGEDIVLKSAGDQLYSYTFSCDAALAVIFLLKNAACGQAVNVADPDSDITLRELAGLCARTAGKNVITDIPSENERRGYSAATTATLDASLAESLGLKTRVPISRGIPLTISILKDLL